MKLCLILFSYIQSLENFYERFYIIYLYIILQFFASYFVHNTYTNNSKRIAMCYYI